MNDIYCLLNEWLPIIKDFVLTGAAVVAGYVGLKGLGTWRQQFKGSKEYELAKRLLTSVYELREAIYSVRHPLMYYSEESDMPDDKLKELSDRERRWHALAQAYQKRWEPVPKAKTGLDANLLEAEVVWGKKMDQRGHLNRNLRFHPYGHTPNRKFLYGIHPPDHLPLAASMYL